MAAQYSVPDPGTPGKMFMNYQGLASYLSSGGEPAQVYTHTHTQIISPLSSLTSPSWLCQVTTTGSLTPTMTTTPSPTPAAAWRTTGAARTDTLWSSHVTPAASRPPSRNSSAKSKRRSAWLESSSPCCSPVRSHSITSSWISCVHLKVSHHLLIRTPVLTESCGKKIFLECHSETVSQLNNWSTRGAQ